MIGDDTCRLTYASLVARRQTDKSDDQIKLRAAGLINMWPIAQQTLQRKAMRRRL
jgi:hypothetical protein